MIANVIACMIAEVIALAKADFHRLDRIPIAKTTAINRLLECVACARQFLYVGVLICALLADS